MPRIETVVERYGILKGYEWQIRFPSGEEWICVPTFRYTTDPEYRDEVTCWPSMYDFRSAEFLGLVKYMKWKQFLVWLPPEIERIIISKSGEEIRRYYHVENISTRDRR